jgi:NitT/TauT family transport system permease protein
VARLSLVRAQPGERIVARLLRLALPPLSVPIALLLAWHALVVGNAVPKGIFPSVVHVLAALRASLPVLLSDAYVTFVKEVALGLAIGVAAGMLVGIVIANSRFLQRGFLPLAAAFGAVPIVALAPVLGRAFGVDWHSKAAVVVIVTFFPVVLNTVQGLTSVDPARLELLRAYAAKPWQVFTRLRLPNALPYLFNAVKLASVIAIISVIVAEFLIPGPPEGLGQRISLSARRGAYDVVFAAIFVSSTISIIIYGALTALERRVTHWHASFRDPGP